VQTVRPWAIVVWVGLAIALLSGSVLAQSDAAEGGQMYAPAVHPATVIADFTQFAGSLENATALVEGLRTGGEVVMLERDETAVRFASPAGPLGYGNISVALSLAQTNLAIYGFFEPGAEQIACALAGGEVLVEGEILNLPGVLNMRAHGMQWGRIAEELGFTLADAVRFSTARDAEARMEIAHPRYREGVEIVDRSISVDKSLQSRRPDRPEKVLK
jgi:hypothetical protein